MVVTWELMTASERLQPEAKHVKLDEKFLLDTMHRR